MKSVNLKKVNKFIKRKQKEKLTQIREGYYSLGEEPVLAHVYKDRSPQKEIMGFELKIPGTAMKSCMQHWSWH